MVRAVDSKYTFWMAGYYDDFTSAKAIPDDLNTMSTAWQSIETHHGNPLNGLAPYNPRYKYAWFVRGTSLGSGLFNGANFVLAAKHKTHNPRMSSWLTFDATRYNTGQYEGITHIQYPDSLTNSNRQRFDASTGNIGNAYLATDPKQGYMMFCNGYNTNCKYYAFNGSNDSSFGRDTLDEMVFKSQDYTATTGGVNTQVGIPSNGSAIDWSIRTNLAGVYMGEIVAREDIEFLPSLSGTGFNSGKAGAFEHLLPISSPSKTNFLIQEIYSHTNYRSPTYWFPVLAYDGSLNAKGTGDIFTIRMAAMANANTTGTSVNTKVKLSIGNWNMANGLTITSDATTDTVGVSTDFAINLELTSAGIGSYEGVIKYPYADDLTTYTPSYIETTINNVWNDYDFKLDFDTQKYQLYVNGVASGVATSFNAKSDGTDWTPADFYGWTVEAMRADLGMTILYDRVGIIRPLTEHIGQSADTFPVADSFGYNTGVNQISTINLSLIDDNGLLSMLEFFNQASYADWSLLCFRDNIDRPFWRGSLTSMSYDFNSNDRTPKIKLSAEDYFSSLDHQIPMWELGTGGDADSTSVVSYNRQEAQNKLDSYYFGAKDLETANAGLGYNEVLDGTGVWEARVDSRMRDNSAHPIQMYLGEDAFGTNNPYNEWDEAIPTYATTAAKYRSLHSRWIKDIGNSVWFRHMFGRMKSKPLLQTTITAGTDFEVGDTSLTLDAGGAILANGGHIEFVDADGSVDSGVVTSASVTVTVTNIHVAWFTFFEIEKPLLGTPSVGYRGTGVQPVGFYVPNKNSTVYGCALVPTAQTQSDKMTRTISGSDWPVFNDTWQFFDTGDTTTQNGTSYRIYRLAKPMSISQSFSYAYNGNADWLSVTNLTLTNHAFSVSDVSASRVPAGVPITIDDGLDDWANGLENHMDITLPYYADQAAQDWLLNELIGANRWDRIMGNINTYLSVGDYTTNSILQGACSNVSFRATTNMQGGQSSITLPATNFFQKDHPAGTTVNIIDMDDDYKHIYILWADMRNDGNANASANFRKENFGLLKPTGENYSVGLVYADNNTSGGEDRQEFVDLPIGQDIDLWEMGSTDPLTGTKWSALATLGSNNESDAKYHNWEDKAGAFLIIDSAKFFNLNTRSNGGRCFQTSGGKKEIGDFIVETEGFPILLDNYWLRATTTPQNIATYNAWANNYQLFDNQPMNLRVGIEAGDRMLQLANGDIKFFGGSVANLSHRYPTLIKLVSHEKEKVFHANVYQKLGSSTSLVIDQTVAGRMTITAPVSTDAYYARQGHFITVSSSNIGGAQPTLDGEYQVIVSTQTGSNRTLVVLLNDTASAIGTGTATVTLDDSYAFYNLADLGIPSTNATTNRTWDGSAYDGIALTSAYLLADSKTVAASTSPNAFTLSSTRWIDYGFKEGLSIYVTRSNTASSKNIGACTITGFDGTGTVMYVDKTLEVDSATGTYNFYSSTFNTYSAEYLINTLPTTPITSYPTVGLKNAVTGVARTINGSVVTISIDSEVDNSYQDLVVYSNASSIYPMRLMMEMQGYVKSKASLTFNESDKFRLTYLDSLTKTWFNQSALYGMPDISTIPRTGDMNVSQKSALFKGRAGVITSMAGTGSANTITSAGHGLKVGDIIDIVNNINVGGAGTAQGLSDKDAPYTTTYTVTAVPNDDSFTVASTNTSYTPSKLGIWRKINSIETFGSVNDCRNTSINNIFAQVQQSSGVGEQGSRSVMSYLMGRDSKPSFRPTYTNGFVFNENNLRITGLRTESSSQISNIRIFYAGDGSFVDYPSASIGSKPRWEIIQSPNIMSQEEALAVAKQEYEKQKQAPLSINCEINSLTDKAMQQNDGNMLYNARYGYIVDASRASLGWGTVQNAAYNYNMKDAWTSILGGNLFGGIQNGLDGLSTEFITQPSDYQGSGVSPTTTTTPPTENYFWYGANSVSYAVQVVDIPHGMPKTSERAASTGTVGGVSYTTTKGDGQLRVIIDIATETKTQSLEMGDNTFNSDYIFTVYLVDYDFVASATQLKAVGKFAGVGSAFSATYSSVKVDSNGLYEINIPIGYMASGGTGAEKIVLSVNYDYLCSLVKMRCGQNTVNADRQMNGNSWVTVNGDGVDYGAAIQRKSIFPLGVRRWSTQGVGTVNERWIGYLWRAEWYAPRLQIVDDLNFVPATTLKYTDSKIPLSNEPMSIKNISWTVSGSNTEKLTLNLERDVSRAAENFTSFIIPKVNFGAKQKKGSTTRDGGGAGNKFGGGKGKTGGTTEGRPKGGAWAAKYGDENINSKSTGALQPILNPDRLNTPDGTTSATNSNFVLGSSLLSNNVNNRIKGVLDFKNSSVVGDNFSVLGQRKPTVAPRDPNAHQSIDSFIIPDGGDAVMASNGFSLSGSGEGITNYGSMKVHLRVPANSESTSIRIFGKVNISSKTTTQKAIIFVTATCVESGDTLEEEITIDVSSSEQNIVFLTGNLAGANTQGNTIEILFEREAGEGNDDASRSALSINNIQIANDTRSVSGKKKSSEFSYRL